MDNQEDYKKLEIECIMCKTKFDIWISTMNYSLELEEALRKNFHQHCPICKKLDELKMKKQE
jgi:hypothetical protein